MAQDADQTARVGCAAPAFDLRCTLAPEYQAGRARSGDFLGRWLLLVFYPRDFSFVCPTELTAISAQHAEFAGRGCGVIAASVDPMEIHEEWLLSPPEVGGVGPLQFPLASDLGGRLARDYGVYVEDRRVAARASFLIDPDGVIQYQVVHSLGVGRSVDELLRVLDALQSGQLCPVSWTLGDGTIDPALELEPGRVLGRFRLGREIGSGGLGQVFEATDLWLERAVAVKIFKPGLRADMEGMLREARAAAALNHPNICTVYDVGREEGLPVLSMELLSGQTLQQRLDDGALGVEEAAEVAHQLASGLTASHAHGVVHGDLKPSNVLITGDATVKVLDFGIARRVPTMSVDGDDPPPPAPEKPPVDEGFVRITGTLAYLSPERLDGSSAESPADVFAFGLILWEMLMGKRALRGSDYAMLVFQLKNLDPARHCAQLPAPFDALVAPCLEPEPGNRPPMGEVVRSLAALVSGSQRD
jgi:eukaryotic-like serine/threonine-protein kinase